MTWEEKFQTLQKITRQEPGFANDYFHLRSAYLGGTLKSEEKVIRYEQLKTFTRSWYDPDAVKKREAAFLGKTLVSEQSQITELQKLIAFEGGHGDKGDEEIGKLLMPILLGNDEREIKDILRFIEDVRTDSEGKVLLPPWFKNIEVFCYGQKSTILKSFLKICENRETQIPTREELWLATPTPDPLPEGYKGRFMSYLKELGIALP